MELGLCTNGSRRRGAYSSGLECSFWMKEARDEFKDCYVNQVEPGERERSEKCEFNDKMQMSSCNDNF